MMNSVVVELPWPSLSGNNHTRGRAGGGRYLTREAKAYRMAVALCVGRRRAPEGQIRVHWLLSPPDNRVRDIANVLKVSEDALTECGFWVDDSNRVIPSGAWDWAPPSKPGGIYLTVTPYSKPA